MKLDKIKFARLLNYIGARLGCEMSSECVNELDDLITFEAPEAKANPADLNELMRAIHAGEKIAAIKAYRTMTGYGLKESKDAVELGWKSNYTKDELINKANLYTKSDTENMVIVAFIKSLY